MPHAVNSVANTSNVAICSREREVGLIFIAVMLHDTFDLKTERWAFPASGWGIIGAATGMRRVNRLKSALRVHIAAVGCGFPAQGFAPVPEQQ
ncbi:hypothetical protein RS1P1_17030 [Pseudomonas moraviensis]|nr:hypothetical protein RS1P1_17030 [Pseudomonas moraviensis]